MLQLAVLRNETDWVKQRLAVKHFHDENLVDTILLKDEMKRKLQTQSEELQAKQNASAKEIGKLMASGEKDKAEAIKADVASQKETGKQLLEQVGLLEKEIHDCLVQLPNLPNSIVPLGKTPEENEVVKTGNDVPQLHANALPHWDLVAKHNLIDFELGTKITGAGFPVYINQGARLQRGLINYFLDFNTAAGYTEYQVPHMVNAESAFATGQLPDKEGQMYHATVDDFYLIPTAEVPVTNIYRDTIIKENQLPTKLTAFSQCYRREAGSYGKDVRGLNRLHQFDKVEIVQFAHPSKSYEVLDEMVAHVEKLVQSLEMPYRILRLCGGDMSFASALTYDFEVYSTAQQRWLEVSSVSNFETFQTNRAKVRFKGNEEGSKTQLVHSLNGSSLALPRIVACLLENHQDENGIKIPKVLIPYVGFERIG
jgi:seryl-tRNA synthetase